MANKNRPQKLANKNWPTKLTQHKLAAGGLAFWGSACSSKSWQFMSGIARYPHFLSRNMADGKGNAKGKIRRMSESDFAEMPLAFTRAAYGTCTAEELWNHYHGKPIVNLKGSSGSGKDKGKGEHAGTSEEQEAGTSSETEEPHPNMIYWWTQQHKEWIQQNAKNPVSSTSSEEEAKNSTSSEEAKNSTSSKAKTKAYHAQAKAKTEVKPKIKASDAQAKAKTKVTLPLKAKAKTKVKALPQAAQGKGKGTLKGKGKQDDSDSNELGDSDASG